MRMGKKMGIVLAVLMSLFLVACGSGEKGYPVVINGESVELTADLQKTVKVLVKAGMNPYDLVVRRAFSYDGLSYSDKPATQLAEEGNIMEAFYQEGNDYAGDDDSLGMVSYGFYAKYSENVSFANGLTIKDSYEDALKKGYSDAGAYVICLIADGKQVSTDKYKDMALDYLMTIDEVDLRTIYEKYGFIEDSEDDKAVALCTSGGNIVSFAIQPYSSLRAMLYAGQTEGVKLGAAPGMTAEEYYEYNKNAVDAYTVYFAAVDTGNKYRSGKIKSYGAVTVNKKEPSSEPDIQVNIAVENKIISDFREAMKQK